MEDLLTEFLPFILGFLTIFVAYLFWRRSNSAEENSSEEDTTNESKYLPSFWLSFNLETTLVIV